nr:hypothetical protein [uncultured Sphingomonas sp.]
MRHGVDARLVTALILGSAVLAAPAFAAPQIVTARGQWAVLVQGQSCEAGSRSLTPQRSGQSVPRAGISFDAGGPRRGQLAVRLSRQSRPDASVILSVGDAKFLLVARGDMAWSRGPAQERAIIAAMRTAPTFAVEARSDGYGRFVDRYDLSGAPLAIDAAAVCAARLANR